MRFSTKPFTPDMNDGNHCFVFGTRNQKNTEEVLEAATERIETVHHSISGGSKHCWFSF